MRKSESPVDIVDDTIVAIVCNLFCEGFTATEIAKIVEMRHHVKMSREEPYKVLRYAARNGWFRFVPPNDSPFASDLAKKFQFLRRVEVVHGVARNLAQRTALVLMELLRELRASQKSEIHIGWSGGHTMRRTAEELARLLSQPSTGLPERLVFHALVSGFDVDDPITDPSAFFTYFVNRLFDVEVGFVGLHAPAIVETADMDRLRRLPGIREAYDCRDQLDIVVTSAASYKDEHSSLQQYYNTNSQAQDVIKRLEDDKCVGDMLWLPLARGGPINIEKYPFRGMTIIDLSMLPSLIRRGKNVVLSIGACGASGCNRPKPDILKVILEQSEPLITHLVSDYRTACNI